ASFYRRGEVEKRVMSQLGIERRELSDPELERVQELAELDELRGRVAQELANLPADQAYLLRLRIVEQLEYSQLAAELHVSEQATRQRVSRALKALTQRLDLDARSEERQR
ncbi:MAG: Sigma-70, region 4, partial [Gaiellales bacterium]|nr:Sigma-70, region 4 [Gaiellales bacterium]